VATATSRTGIYGQPCAVGHTLVIYDRGGTERVNQIVDLATVKWGRKKNAKTQAIITITGGACRAQSAVLKAVKSRRHEAVLFRGSKRVWEGPIVQIRSTSTFFEITANDILEYLEKTSLSKDWPGPGVVTARVNLIKNPSGLRGVAGYTGVNANLGSTSNGGLTYGVTAAQAAAQLAGVTVQTLTVGVELLANTAYTFSAQCEGATGQPGAVLAANGTGLVQAAASSTITVDSQYHATSVTFTTAAAGTVAVGLYNSGAIGVGNSFTIKDMQLELGSGATAYFDGSETDTGDFTYAWSGAADASTSSATSIVGPPGMTDRISEIIDYELTTSYEMDTTNGLVEVTRWEAQDPPANVLPFVEITDGPTQTLVATTAFQMSVGQHLYNLVADSLGVSFSTIGRRLRVWDGYLSQTRTMTEKDVSGDFQVIEAGSDFATIKHVASTTIAEGGDPAVGHAIATDPTTGDPDDYFGPWEDVVSTSSQSTTTAPTQPELNSQANAAVAGKYPVPLELIAANGSVLLPSAGLDINDLVAGINIPVKSTTNIRNMNQMQELLEMTVTEDGTGEKITVSLGVAGYLLGDS
jgi:hypothetical protein